MDCAYLILQTIIHTYNYIYMAILSIIHVTSDLLFHLNIILGVK